MFNFSKNFHLLPIILICFYYSVDKYVMQSAVDGGLVLSGLVHFPENFINVKSAINNSYTHLFYFTAILLKLNFSVDFISIILTFIIISFYSLGIFFLTLGITKSKNLALLLSLSTIILRKHFGNVDYGVFFFAEHSFGAFSLSAFTLIIGLLANKNFKTAGLISAILISSHSVVGIWTLLLFISIYLIDNFFFKNINNNCKLALKKVLLGSLVWLIPIILGAIFYINNIVDKNSYDVNDFNIYKNVWDAHRNIFTINYNYIFKTLFLLFLFIFYVYKYKKSENLIFSLFLIITCVGSLVLYLSFKIIPNSYIPQFLINPMPTRVFILHSVVGYPLIISIIFYIIKKLNIKFNLNFKNYKKFLIFTPIVLILLILLNPNNISNKAEKFYINKIEKRFLKFSSILFDKKSSDEDLFWKKVRSINSDGYYITTFNSAGPTLRYGRKPYIINTSYIDNVAYFPYLASETRIIIEDIYGVSFQQPPIKFLAAIIDTWFRDNFEQRSNEDWKEISDKYNISGVIVPSDWELMINNKIVSQKFTAYLF